MTETHVRYNVFADCYEVFCFIRQADGPDVFATNIEGNIVRVAPFHEIPVALRVAASLAHRTGMRDALHAAVRVSEARDKRIEGNVAAVLCAIAKSEAVRPIAAAGWLPADAAADVAADDIRQAADWLSRNPQPDPPPLIHPHDAAAAGIIGDPAPEHDRR